MVLLQASVLKLKAFLPFLNNESIPAQPLLEDFLSCFDHELCWAGSADHSHKSSTRPSAWLTAHLLPLPPAAGCARAASSLHGEGAAPLLLHHRVTFGGKMKQGRLYSHILQHMAAFYHRPLGSIWQPHHVGVLRSGPVLQTSSEGLSWRSGQEACRGRAGLKMSFHRRSLILFYYYYFIF